MDENNNFMDDGSDRQLENNHSENFGNDQTYDPNTSERLQNNSESFGNNSEGVQKDSETIPNTSENKEESFGNKNLLSEKTPDHTLSVREVARLFEEAGAPRTERSIINWCNPNKRGIRRLDCYFDDADRKYFVTPQSVHKVIQEERKKQQFTDFKVHNISENNSDDFGTASETPSNPSENVQNDSDGFRTTSERVQNGSESFRQDSEPLRNDSEPEQKREQFSQGHFSNSKSENDRVRELENELNDLRITNKAKDYFIDRLQEQSEKERQGYIEERRVLIDQLTSSTKLIGELETKLLQIEAPKQQPLGIEGVETHSSQSNFGEPAHGSSYGGNEAEHHEWQG